MVVAAAFTGFHGEYDPIQIVINDWPDNYFKRVSGMLGAELKVAHGILEHRRRDIQAGGFPALLVTGIKADSPSILSWLLIVGTPSMTVVVQVTAECDVSVQYPDDVIEAALASLVFRQDSPLEDAFAALPFNLANTADFRVTRFLGSNGVWLTEGPLDVDPDFIQPRLLVRWVEPSPVPPNSWTKAKVSGPWLWPLMDMVITERTQDSVLVWGEDWFTLKVVGAGPNGPELFSFGAGCSFEGGSIEAIGQTRVVSRGDMEPRFRDAALSAAPKPRRDTER